MTKKLLCILAALMLLAAPALAENPDTGSWSQINQAVSRKEGWQRVVSEEDERFRLGEITPLEGYEGLSIAAYGAYPSMDGSTVCVPMAMELARQWLGLEEGDMNGFVTFSTTPYAYDRLTQGKANPLVTIKSQGVMMDDTHPIDLVLATYPNADERQAAADAGVELVYVPFCCDAFVFMVNEKNPVDGLTVRQSQEIYTGKHTTWADFGGQAQVLEAYQRPHGSGSQTAMEAFMKDRQIATKSVLSITGGSIGYSFRYYMSGMVSNSDVKMLSLNGVYPNEENIRDGKYPVITTFYAIYRKDNENENVKKLVDFILSEKGQELINKSGYVGINK